LPLLLLLLIGIIEYARLLYAWLAVENITRMGVRYASTGRYDAVYCTDLDGNGTPCAGDSRNEEIDAARIPSIEDETRRTFIGLPYDESATKYDQTYLNLTVCSRNADLFVPPQMGSPGNGTNYAECRPAEDAGSPGQRVIVAADYNFTFIVMPIFGFDPVIHLASYREGTVEMFRVSRVVNVPPTILSG